MESGVAAPVCHEAWKVTGAPAADHAAIKTASQRGTSEERIVAALRDTSDLPIRRVVG